MKRKIYAFIIVVLVMAFGLFYEVLSVQGEEQTENMADSGEAPMPCQDYYDREGNLIWKGITLEEYNSMTPQQEAEFENAMKRFGESTEEITVYDELLLTDQSSPAERLLSVSVEYNEQIPYACHGREWGLGHVKYPEGYDNSMFEWNGGFGLDGQGYVLWLVRQSFGYTPESLYQGIDTSKLQRVSADDLQAGDICVEETECGNRYGVAVGEVNERMVVTMCDAVRIDNFPCGSSHFVFDGEAYFGYYAPVKFTSYYRIPDEDWGGKS